MLVCSSGMLAELHGRRRFAVAAVGRRSVPSCPAHMTRRSWALLVLVAAVWGGSFILTAIAIRDLPVPVVAVLRTGVGALVLLPVALASRALVVAIVGILAAVLMSRWAVHRLGGVTGDVLGATVEATFTTVLVMLAVTL